MRVVSIKFFLILCSLTVVSLIGTSGCGDDEQGSSLLLGVWSGPYIGVVDSGTMRMDFNLSSSSFRGTYTAFGRFGPDEGLVSGDWVEGVMVGVFESDAGCQSQFTATLDTINLLLTMSYSGTGDCADTGLIVAHKGEDVSGTWSGFYVLPNETGALQTTVVQTGTTFTGTTRVLNGDGGDSGSVSGSVVDGVFEMTGQFGECNATFDVNLSRKAEQMDGTMLMTSPCPAGPIVIKLTREHEGPFSVSGNWTGTVRDSAAVETVNLSLTQTESSVSGTYNFPGTGESGTISGTMNGNVFTGQPSASECTPTIRMVLQSDGSRMIGYAKESEVFPCEGGVETLEFVRQ